jgi:hypothetical protein
MLVLALLLISAPVFTFAFNSAFAVHTEINSVSGTLIDRIRFYSNYSLVNWTDNYYGLVFNKQTKADFESYVDRLANASKWTDVLRWSARLKKLGVEREEAIKSALGNLSKAGELPRSGSDYYSSFWCVYDRDLLYSVYYYSNKYGYLTDKWNATKAFHFFKDSVDPTGSSDVPSVFYVYEDGTVDRMFNRYYDENAQTASTYLIFYELGIAEALNSSKTIWSYVNNNHWSESGQYFNYRPTWFGFECEAPYFAKVFSLLYWWDHYVENISRLIADTQTRFLNQLWESPQWTEWPTGTIGYVVMHMNPSNAQRRLQNTLGAWFTMLGMYNVLDTAGQNDLRALLMGYGNFDPAWMLLYHPNAELYDSGSGMFKWSSADTSATSEATCLAITLQALMGIVPVSTTIAFPLEEYHYEYNYDVDPDLFRIDSVNNTLRIAVADSGVLEFIYGDRPVACDFPSGGVYEIAFSDDWNTVINVSKPQNLPTDKKFLWWPTVRQEHDIEIADVTLSKNIAEQESVLPIDINVQNKGFYPEVFNITLCSNATIIGNLLNISLSNRNSTSMTFDWNTTGMSKGEYIISAKADVVPGETNTADNIKEAGTMVTVVSKGHDIAVKQIIVHAYNISVIVKNYGNTSETFNVTIYANSSIIASQAVTLESGVSTDISSQWNTTCWPRGNYLVSACAEPIPGELDTTDNNFTYGLVTLYICDVDGNGIVDMLDLYFIASRFGTNIGEQNYIANYDINTDGRIDMLDLYVTAMNFGQHYP